MPAPQIQVTLAVVDTDYSDFIEHAFTRAGAMVTLLHADSAQQLLQQIADNVPSLLVIEPVDRQWEILDRLRPRYPGLSVVMVLTGRAEDLPPAVSRSRVDEVWQLPADLKSIAERAQAIMQRLRSTAQDVNNGENTAEATYGTPEPPAIAGNGSAPPLMTGGNPRMAEIRDTIAKVSGTDVTILIRGESGVGKEVAARMIYEHSRRRQKPFIKVNCAAIPHDLLESELFGYEAGAFTGAIRSKPGKFELADHGTLFLDEIAEMHPSLQAKLLHVLQDGRFSRLGAKRDISVNVRIVCATNKLLEERVREGLFREDLLYRINVVTIFLPPLRERRDEIPILTDHLLQKYAAQYGRTFHPLSVEVSRRMIEYDWPGNIRELENLCKRFILVGSETQILRELSNHNNGRISPPPEKELAEQPRRDNSTGAEFAASPSSLSLLEIGRRAAWEAERRAILDMLETTHWNRREASRRLQVSYKALLNKIKQMELDAIGTSMDEK